MAVLSLKYGGLLSKSAAPRKTRRKANTKQNKKPSVVVDLSWLLISVVMTQSGPLIAVVIALSTSLTSVVMDLS